MTEIEQKALALVDEFADCEQVTFEHSPPYSLRKALCRALEQKAALQAEFDQFRQEVSDAVEQHIRMSDEDCSDLWRSVTRGNLSHLILPKPADPLVEVMNEMGFGWSQTASGEFRQALAKRGLKIAEAE